MPLRFVLLSDHGAHGQALARVLGERGIPLDAVVWHSKLSPEEQAASGPKALMRRVQRWLGFYRAHRHFYSFLKTRVLFVDGANSQSARKALQRLAPDYIVVGSGSILKPPIIETAKCGVLNSHPGLLPWVRGSGVVGHALEQGIPIGATLHYIDAGVDTGAIIERRLLPVMEPQSKLAELETAAGALAAQLMGDAVGRIIESGQKPTATDQKERFPLYRWPDANGRRRLQELTVQGRANELFEEWREFSSGAPDWVLPPEMMEVPESG